MKKTEKILLLLLALFFMVKMLGFHAVGIVIISLIWLLSFFYFAGSYWLFKSETKQGALFSIVTGIAFGLSIFILPAALRLDLNTFFIYYHS
jgi:hypothetical protein